MSTVIVASFESAAPAERLRERLNAAGFHADVHDESRLQRFWFLAKPHAAIRLKVPSTEAAAAGRLFEEWQDHDDALQEALRCPQCRSLRIDYPQMTRKFILPTLMAHLLHLFGVLHHEFYCQVCHCTWRRPAKRGRSQLPATQVELPRGFHRRTT